MEHITIVIPSRNREAKLARTLASIPPDDRISILVGLDGKQGPQGDLFTSLGGDMFRYFPKHRGSVAVRNELLRSVEDGALCATDDVVFEDGSIQGAFDLFNETFPDDDGVVGFHQEGVSNYNSTGVVLVGKTFLARYPDRQLYYHEYFHFACQEIHWLACRLDKFVMDREKVRLFHYHPAFHKSEMDEAHKEARVHKKRDHALIARREREGSIWGLNTK